MGNIHSRDAARENSLTRRRSFQLKIIKEIQSVKVEKSIQCGLLVPPTPQGLVRQSDRCSNKIIQVGTRPCVRNRSTLTEVVFEPSSPTHSEKRNGSPALCYYGSRSDGRYPRIYHPYIHFQDPYRTSGMGYPDVVPETCVFTTNQPMYFDLPRMRQAPSQWKYPAPHANILPVYQQTSGLETGDVIWQAPVRMNSFKSPPIMHQQYFQTVDKTGIKPIRHILQKSKSWDGQLNQEGSENIGTNKPFQSMETIMTSIQRDRFSSLNLPPRLSNSTPSYSANICEVSDNNRPDNLYFEKLPTSPDYVPYVMGYQTLPKATYGDQIFCSQESSSLAPAFAVVTDFQERPTGEIFRFPKASSMVGIQDIDRGRMIKVNSLSNNGHNSWMNGISEVQKAAPKPVGPLGDVPPEKEAKCAPKTKNALFGRPSKFRFYLKESPRVTKMLMDTQDRRIRSICDRFQCDLEVYSKVPKSGFLQYAIDITAPDTTALYACSRNLDSALGWFLTAQLAAARLLRY